jgi:S1-C subfamily serine protease
VTLGVISFVGRQGDDTIFDQTSAPCLPGSSGGLIATRDGRVLGLVSRGVPPSQVFFVPTWVIRNYAQDVGVGFTLDPREATREVVPQGRD